MFSSFQDEINNLETLVEGGAAPQLPPYVVADTSVLCYNLTCLKQLTASKRFVVIVPLVGKIHLILILVSN